MNMIWHGYYSGDQLQSLSIKKLECVKHCLPGFRREFSLIIGIESEKIKTPW